MTDCFLHQNLCLCQNWDVPQVLIMTQEPLPFFLGVASHVITPRYPEHAQCLLLCSQRESGGVEGSHLFLTCSNQDNVDFLRINVQLGPGLQSVLHFLLCCYQRYIAVLSPPAQEEDPP